MDWKYDKALHISFKYKQTPVKIFLEPSTCLALYGGPDDHSNRSPMDNVEESVVQFFDWSGISTVPAGRCCPTRRSLYFSFPYLCTRNGIGSQVHRYESMPFPIPEEAGHVLLHPLSICGHRTKECTSIRKPGGTALRIL